MDVLVQLLLALAGQIGPISALITKMKAEGRTKLTADEWKVVDDLYDSAHADALAALAEAKAQGR